MSKAKGLVTYEEYGPGYRSDLVAHHNLRTAPKEAGFLLPFLSDGMNILDCGCGRGSITLGLADLLPSAKITGCDVGIEVLDAAKSDAKDRGLSNVSFKLASVYNLEFQDANFDAVLVHAVLQHLSEPAAALKELHRVMRPGGVIGLRDDDRGSMILAPESADMARALEVMDWFMKDSGGDPQAGRRHRARLIEAGFTDVVCSATCEVDGTSRETEARGLLAANAFRGKLGKRAVAAGYIDERECEYLANVCECWGRDPAAFDSITWCEAVGRKAQ